MYYVMRASVPSLHRESTDSLIYIIINYDIYYIENSLPVVRLGWLAPARQIYYADVLYHRNCTCMYECTYNYYVCVYIFAS